VPQANAEACLRALTAAGMRAAIIGVVEETSPDAPMIRIAGSRAGG
jgi:hydrogenase maturation factor